MCIQKTRYLIYFQYIGTKYSGVAKTPPNQHNKGVLNYLQKAVLNLRPPSPVKLAVSSRTDAGVHALCNTAHFDLESPEDEKPASEARVVRCLNRGLQAEQIVVLGARIVPPTFHARASALSRTYVYRLATGCNNHFDLPIFERDLCCPTERGHFNLEAMREAASYLRGTHNFMTFCSVSENLPFRNPVKHLSRLDIRPAPSFSADHGSGSPLKFWELEFTSNAFLYRQVRRMVGVLVAVGQGQMQPYHVRDLLDAQDLMAFPCTAMAPPAGLFLKHVEYDESDMTFGRSEEEEP